LIWYLDLGRIAVYARNDEALHNIYMTPAEAVVIAEAIARLPDLVPTAKAKAGRTLGNSSRLGLEHCITGTPEEPHRLSSFGVVSQRY
jgi:hypothetical protein